MRYKNFNEAIIAFLGRVKEELTPIDGYCFVDYKYIKGFSSDYADSIFFELSVSDITKPSDLQKGIYIEFDGINDAIKYYLK